MNNTIAAINKSAKIGLALLSLILSLSVITDSKANYDDFPMNLFDDDMHHVVFDFDPNDKKVGASYRSMNVSSIKPLAGRTHLSPLCREPFTVLKVGQAPPDNRFIPFVINPETIMKQNGEGLYLGYPNTVPKQNDNINGHRRTTTLLSAHSTLAAHAMDLTYIEQYIAEASKNHNEYMLLNNNKISMSAKTKAYFGGGGIKIVDDWIVVNLFYSFKAQGAIESSLIDDFVKGGNRKPNLDHTTSTLNGMMLLAANPISPSTFDPLYKFMSSYDETDILEPWLWPYVFNGLVDRIGLPIRWDTSGLDSPHFDFNHTHHDFSVYEDMYTPKLYAVVGKAAEPFIAKANSRLFDYCSKH